MLTIWLFAALMIASDGLHARTIDTDAENPRVGQLLLKAEQALAADRLTTPPGDNTVAHLEQVLAIAPDNRRAHGLLDKVIARYARLVEVALSGGKRARQCSPQRAVEFRNRASKVVSKHHLSNTALERMDRRIAAVDEVCLKRQTERVSTIDAMEPMLKDLVNRHVMLAESFLDNSNLPEAEWHAVQAENLAAHYGLAAPRLQRLQQRLAADRRGPKGKDSEVRDIPDAGLHRRLTQLTACHVASGEFALRQGDIATALRHKQAAEEIVEEYGFPDHGLKRLSMRLSRTKPRNRTPTSPFRMFGTF